MGGKSTFDLNIGLLETSIRTASKPEFRLQATEEKE